MSARTQMVARREGAAGGRVQQKPVMAKRRPLGANHTLLARDQFEEQADDAAARILRGEIDVARRLTRVPAAAMRVPGSSGEPLAPALRKDLEKGFGAELSAIRIHRDASAHTAAREESAHAFTSGPDIFFDGGEYEPRSFAGRRLLLHEVAHAIQQTGRMTSEGRLGVAAAAGSGAIQREPDDFVKYADDYGLFNAAPSWDDIKKEYAGVADFATHQAILDPLIPPTLPASTGQLDDLAKPTTDPAFKGFSDEIKGLYADALKFAGANKAAANVLIANPNTPTTFRSRNLYEAVRAQSLGWISGLAAADSFTKKYYPDRVVAVYNAFLLSPGAAPLDLEPGASKAGAKNFKKLIMDELKGLMASTGLVNNELRAAMLLALYYLNESWPDSLQKTLASVRGGNRSLVQAHAELSKLLSSGQAANRSPSSIPEVVALFGAILDSIQKLATKAANYWSRTVAFQTARLSKTGFESLTAAEVRSIADGIKTDPSFKRLPAIFLDTGTRLFAKPKGNLLTAGTYATRVKQRQEALRGEMATYFSRVAELVRTGKDSEPEGLRLGLALAFLADVEQVLSLYDASRDKAASGRSDERIASRLRLAGELLEIARVFDWDPLRDAANAVFDEGLRIAILSGWEPDVNVKFGDLTGQIGGELEGFEGTHISGALLDRYAYIAYFTNLTDILGKLLKERGADFTDRPDPILAEGVKKANEDAKAQRPRKFVVRDWEVGDPSLAKVKGVTSYMPASFGKAVFDHELTKALLKREEKPTDYTLAPASLFEPSAGPLFLWIVPRFDEFIKLIAGVQVVKTAVEAYWKAIPGNAKPLPDPAKEPFAWLDVLRRLTAELQAGDENAKARLQQIGNAISGAVQTQFTTAEQAAHDKEREAASHERRVLVEKRLRPALVQYDRNDLRTWNIPETVFAIIRNFAAFVLPDTDRPLQVSALALEIGQELMDAFGPKESLLGTSEIQRFDIIDTVLTLAFQALRFWDAGQPDPTKIQSGQAAPVNPVAAVSWLPQSELEQRAATLGKLRDSLGRKAESEQKRNGLRGKKDAKSLSSVYWDDEGMSLIKWNMAYTSLSPGTTFSLYGTDYLLVEIFETFTFHPGFGSGETLGVNWPSGGQRPGSAKLLDETGAEMKPAGRKLFTVFVRPRLGDPQTYEITDKDTAKLTWFSQVLAEHLGFEYLKGAGVFILKYANLIMDVLEFMPGVGQGLATARFVASILETIGGAEFQDVLDAFSKDGVGAFEKIFDSFAKVVKLDELANVLIFDEDFTESTRSHPSLRGKQDRQKSVESRGGVWTRIAKLLKNVVEIGVMVLDRIKRLFHRVQVPVRDAQLWVLRHPIAVLVLDLIERAFDVLSSLSIDDLSQAAEELVEKGWKQMIKDAANQAAQQVADRGRDTLDTLRHLELPEEVIPVEWIIDFIIDLAVRALRAKYRKGAQAVRAILRSLGLWDKVLSKIKDGLYAAGVNPNILYQKYVREKLEPWFESARDTFAGDLINVLTQVPFLSQITKPKGTPINLDFSGLGFEGYQAKSPQGTGSWPAGGQAGEGRPLTPQQRQPAEGAFGHDLGHVRLHSGNSADGLTQSFGADGLTTGSHVFLRSGLDPTDGKGKHVLHHELAHVVQQTGPRPLGMSFSAAPSPGRPGRGVTWDPAREAAADRAAKTAGSGRIANGPMAVGGRVQGVQPSFTDKFLRGFLHHLHADKDIIESREDIEKARKDVKLDAEGTAVAAALSPALKPWLDKKSAFDQPFSSVQPQLKTFAEDVWPEFEKSIPLLVSRAVTTMSAPKTEGEDKGTQAYIPIEMLKVQLERELYALTSMAFVIELHGKKGSKLIKEREIVDKDNPVKGVQVVYVYLPLLKQSAASEKLWDLLVTNTYQGTADYSPATHDSFKAATKLVLGRGKPSPDTYDSTRFKLSGLRAQVVRNQRGRLVDFADKSKDWPTVEEYRSTDGAGARAGVKDIGPRLGTYATWGPSAKSVNDRDAHHMVQYLLFEYFRNAKSKKPFPLLGKQAYPGVEPSGSEVKRIVRGTSGIDVETYFVDHGGKVPTIFLARHTHQSGIHYHTEPPDDGSSARPTQGGTVDNFFKSSLDDYKQVMQDAPTLAQLEQNRKDGKPDDPVGGSTKPVITYNRVSSVIFTATQATYKDMWGEMKPKLKTALATQEVAYYNTVAQLRGDPAMKAGDMTQVFQTVTDKSEKEIGTIAGFGPGYKG